MSSSAQKLDCAVVNNDVDGEDDNEAVGEQLTSTLTTAKTQTTDKTEFLQKC